ncbi:phage terminase small subunit [Rivihabitans pingtungensis]|nr:phage terminase small subunit [Rivihabitans pingtungensis]
MAERKPLTPAAAKFQRALAARASGAPAAGANGALPEATGTQYELMLAKLLADRRDLKQIQSVERKIEHKRKILPDYTPWVEGVLSAESPRQDDVVMTVLVWRIDVGDYPGALDIASYALRNRLTLPDQYQRSLGCLLVEEISDAALRAIASGQPPDVVAVQAIMDMARDEDMPDEVRAKGFKAIGLGLTESDPPAALTALREAMRLHDKCGVKKDIERLERATRSAQQDTAGHAGA